MHQSRFRQTPRNFGRGDINAETPAGSSISGIAVPADMVIAQDLPMVLNDAGVIGLSLNGKSFPVVVT